MQKELPTEATAELTEREQEILKLLATGTSNKEMANLLRISSNTVKVHLRNIFAKIGAASRTEAAMYAVNSGLVKTTAGASQMDGIAPSKEDALAASQAAAGEVVPRPRPFYRLATMTAIILVLVAIIGMGILLTKQQAALAIGTSLPSPTAASHWHILASLPTARTGLAITTFENQVYAIGGESATGMTGTVDRYDPATDAWVTVSQMPVPVTDVNAAVIGGKIYIPGGRLTSGKMTNALEIYSPRQDTWENGSNLPMPMSAYADGSI